MAAEVVFTSFFHKYFYAMKLSPEIIQERMFEAFRKDVTEFYDDREERYFVELEEKMLSGEIDINSKNFKDVVHDEAKKFIATRPAELLKFIKDYVNTNMDIVLDAVSEGIMDRETGEVSMEVLKHILIAGEMNADPKTKLK
jgi:hypothetical protein